jgi:hypothetical protein
MYMEEYRQCGGNVGRMEKFKPADPEHPERGFGVKDLSIVGDVLERLQQNVEVLERNATDQDIIFIEFARNDYQAVFKKFSPEFLKDSYFLFLESDVDTCIHRMKNKKHDRGYSTETVKRNHVIPDDVMRGYYGRSSWEYMTDPAGFRKDFSVPESYLLCSKNGGTIEQLYEQINGHPIKDVVIKSAISTTLPTEKRQVWTQKHSKTTSEEQKNTGQCR